jgi:hypothetical protein
MTTQDVSEKNAPGSGSFELVAEKLYVIIMFFSDSSPAVIIKIF